jgi:hypothetical protein
MAVLNCEECNTGFGMDRMTVCGRHYRHLLHLACRALVHCPRGLAEALAQECGIPMPEGYFEPKEKP